MARGRNSGWGVRDSWFTTSLWPCNSSGSRAAEPMRRGGSGRGSCESPSRIPASQRIPDIRIGAQCVMRCFVLLAVVAAEGDRDRDEIAGAGMAVTHGFVQHVQTGAFEQLRHVAGQVGAGAAHGGDLELAGELEAPALPLRLVEVDRLHHLALGACSVLPVSLWNQSRMLSHRREKKPPCGASASATSGTVCSAWPSRLMRRLPICWPFSNGAIRVEGMSITALSLSYWPVLTVTSTSLATPIGKVSASPFHNRGVASGLLVSYSLCVS